MKEETKLLDEEKLPSKTTTTNTKSTFYNYD